MTSVHFIGNTDPVVFAKDLAESLNKIKDNPMTRSEPTIKYSSAQYYNDIHYSALIMYETSE